MGEGVCSAGRRNTTGESPVLPFRVNLVSLLGELTGFFFHSLLQSFLFGDALFGGVFADVFGDLH